MAATLDHVLGEIRAIQRDAARRRQPRTRPRWPMIVLRTPKGWTGPEGGRRRCQSRARGARTRCRSPKSATNAAHRRMLEEWMRSYRPGRAVRRRRRGLRAEIARRCAPSGDRRMSANPHANGGAAAPRPRPARLPRLRGRGRRSPARRPARRPACSGRSCATSSAPTRTELPARSDRTRPSPTGSSAVFEATDRTWEAEILPDRRAPRARRPGHGGPRPSTCARAGWRATC